MCLDQIHMVKEDGFQICFLDEVMFTKKNYLERAWSLKGCPFQIDMSQVNGFAVAAIAMISWQRGIDYFELHKDSINADKFCKYLRNLRRKQPKRKIALFMDQLRVH